MYVVSPETIMWGMKFSMRRFAERSSSSSGQKSGEGEYSSGHRV